MPTTDSPANARKSEPPWQETAEVKVQIPDHELLRRVGVGSYGEVWLARSRIGTLRAVKIVHRKKFKDHVPFERELAGIRRFEPISRTHEGFVDILHIGINEAEGYFYYVMELGDDKVRGAEIDPDTYAPKTLSSEIALHGHVSPGKCLQWGIALSSALHQLHQHGLVHRDIKPSNIIFVSGVPKLADIGLVAELREARSFVGTEGFIPPEGPGKAQADVYSLGKVLYEALTGRDRLDFPSLPKDFDQLADKELFWEMNAVILHACQNESADRYETAWNMHTDLLFLTSGKSVKRWRELERLLLKGKRIALGALPFVLVVGVVAFQVFREIRHRSELRQRDVGMDLAYGNGSMASGDLLGALPYFVHALAVDKRDAQQENNHRLRIGSILAQCPKLTHLWFERKEVDTCDFSPDDRCLVVAQNFGPARVYSLEGDSAMGAEFGPDTGLLASSWSPDGHYIATASANHTARVWHSEDHNACSPALVHSSTVFSTAFSPDSERLLTACEDKIARIWNWRNNQVICTLIGHTGAVRFATYSPNGKLIATGSEDYTARIWEAKTGNCLLTLSHAGWVSSAGFSADNRKLVTACNDHKARVWDVETGARIMPDLGHGDAVKSAKFSPDNRLILTASFDGTVRLWSADTLLPLWPNPILRFADRVEHAAFSHDSRMIAAVCIDGSVWTWDLAGATVPLSTNRHIFSADGNRCLIVAPNIVQLIDQQSGRSAQKEASGEAHIETAGFNSDASLVYTIETNSVQRVLKLCEFSTAKIARGTLVLTNHGQHVAVDNTGTRCLTWTATSAQLWELPAGTGSILGFPNKDRIVYGLFAAHTNRLVVLAGRKAWVCRAETGEPLYPPLQHEHLLYRAAFSPDESRLLTCCQDGLTTKCYAQVWDTETAEPIGKQMRHGDGVLSAVFSPDGQKIVTASEDFTAIVWNARTGEQLTSVLDHSNQVHKALFLPGGRWVATASVDKTARVWDIQSSAPLTPYLPHILGVRDLGFWGNNLITSDREQSWVWELEGDTRPADDLLGLARFLTAGSVAPSGKLRRFSSESFQTDWKVLKERYKSNFTVPAAQIIAWHNYQAQAAEHDGRWFTAQFHLDRLVRLGGPQPDLIRRRDAAITRLKETPDSEESQ